MDDNYKKIQIFIVTRNEQDKNEYLKINDFVIGENHYFEKAYGISIELLTIEDLCAPKRKQEEDREKICNSDIVFFLLFIHMEDFIREDFEAAFKQLKAENKPVIYTYFYEADDNSRDSSVQALMKRLDKELGHYYDIYSHVDTIKLKIMLQLKLDKLDMVEMTFNNGKLVMDGRDIMPLDNIKMIANNSQLKHWKKELKAVESEYYMLKPVYAKGCDDPEICRRYADIASKRQSLIELMEKTEEALFKQSLNMIRDINRGDISTRQKMAYRLFEEGDSEGANSILDLKEMNDEFNSKMAGREARYIAENKSLASIHIRELKTKIEILQTMIGFKGRFEDISAAYEAIRETVYKYGVEYDSIIDYVYYLDSQGDSEKALKTAKELEQVYNQKDIPDYDKAVLWGTIGYICTHIYHMHKEAERYYKEAIKIREELAGKNPDKYNEYLATGYNNAGIFYNYQGNGELAEKYYKGAIKIRKELADKNPDRYSPDLADSYNNAGIFYYDQGNVELAEKYYNEAIKIYTELADKNPDGYNEDLAMSYNNAGIFYYKQGNVELAEKYYNEAIKIRKELADKNPDRYNPDLAESYNNAGNFYKNQGNVELAEKYCNEAIKIYKELADKNPDRYNEDLAMSYNNAGVFYNDQGNVELAEKYYNEAIKIYKELADKNPDRYNEDLAMSYNNAGNFYDDQGNTELAEKYYNEAIKIYKEMAEKNPDRYNEDLATSYNNAGVFYENQGNEELAEKYYKEAIKIREELADKNPDRYNPDLATSYNDAGIFYKNQGNEELAEKYYNKAIKIRKELADKNHDRYNPDLAVSYFNYGLFKKDVNYLIKAYNLSKNYQNNPKCCQIVKKLSSIMGDM